jgi:uncharacterized repeat protein (TIGR01451 family)
MNNSLPRTPRVVVTLFAAFLLFLTHSDDSAAGPLAAALVSSGWDARHATSLPLREVVASAAAAAPAAPEPLLDASLAPSTGLSLVQSFPGFAAPGGAIPSVPASDTSGAAGPDHYMQAVNFSATIYDKDGNIVLGPFPTGQFWSGFAPCGGTWSDVIVLYDQEAQRWFVSRFAAKDTSSSPFHDWYQCFAISQTSDPTGAYNLYAFAIDYDEFNDYPKFGIWPDGYYMTADRNKIFPGLGNFALVFEREKMLNNQPAQYFIFKLDNNGNRAGMLPADWDGSTPPPPGSPDYFVRTLDPNLGWGASAIEVWALAVDWANSLASFTLRDSLVPDSFDSRLCNLNQSCVPQPGTAQGLDPQGGGRPMFRLTYRNFGDHEALTFNQAVEAGDFADHSAIRWYELRKAGPNPWSIYQQNTFAPDSDHRWMGTAALDRFGNMAMGYNVSSDSVFPSLRVAGRLATDALGSLSEEFTLQAGAGSYTGSSQFADYSQMSLDPLDDCTFWFTGTYQPVTSDQYTWATTIAAFRFPDCTADLAVTKTVAPAGPIEAGTEAVYTITLSNNGPADAGNVTLHDDVPTGTSLVSFSVPAGWSCDTPALGSFGAITCTKTQVTNGEVAEFQIAVTVDCSTPDTTILDNTASTSLQTPVDNNPGNDAQQVSFSVNNPAPVVQTAVATDLLPQNNHNLVNVGLTASATDAACPVPPLAVQVFSDEDDQAPTTEFSPDAADIAPQTLRLREERVGRHGDGRVYLIVVSATDEAGGTGFATATVGVPLSQSAAHIASVDEQAAAAKAFADTNGGVPPAGYFLIGDGPVVGPKQ